MLKVENVFKSYKNLQALNGVSFNLEKGQIIGLIGPDGAGKTTLMQLIVTLLKPDKGTIYFDNKNVTEHKQYVRSNIGYMPEKFSLYQDLTVQENLLFFARLFGIDKATANQRMDTLYNFSNLEAFAERKAGALSGGMKQKLALSCMLMHKPECLILDEPSTGVDPVSRKDFWNLLHSLSKEGTAILVSTPYLEEAEDCDKVILINDGYFLAQGSPQALTSGFQPDIYHLSTPNISATYKALFAEYKDNVQLFGSSIHLLDNSKQGIVSIKSQLQKYSDLTNITKAKAVLEDVFLHQLEKQHV